MKSGEVLQEVGGGGGPWACNLLLKNSSLCAFGTGMLSRVRPWSEILGNFPSSCAAGVFSRFGGPCLACEKFENVAFADALRAAPKFYPFRGIIPKNYW